MPNMTLVISIAMLLGLTTPDATIADTAQAEFVLGPDPAAALRLAPTVKPSWQVILPTLANTKIQLVKSAVSRALQVGVGRYLPAEHGGELPPEALNWSKTVVGGQVAVLQLTSEGAAAVRVALQVYAIPDTAQLRVFAVTPSSVAATGEIFAISGAQLNASLATDRAGRDGDAKEPLLYWLPIVTGNTYGLEIYLPPDIPVTALRIAIPGLSHLLADPTAPQLIEKAVTDSGSCTVDVSCHMSSWGDVANAVSRMFMSDSDGNTFMCSGSLVADNDPMTQIPYFITARHCISTQAVASTLQNYWFFRTVSCNGAFTGAGVKVSTGGATMLFSSPTVDITMLRLHDVPPPGATMVGWDAVKAQRGAAIGSVSHPQGDLQKFASGTMQGYVNCSMPTPDIIQGCGGLISNDGNFLVPTFNLGMIQRGSSGSGIFLANSHKLIGIASNVAWYDDDNNHNIDCGEKVIQYNYGRFDIAYHEGMKTWLAAGNTCRAEPGNWSYCSNPLCGLCKAGEGDCDSDQDCQQGLICAQNVGARYGLPVTTDVCEAPNTQNPSTPTCTRQPGDWDYCIDPQCGPCAYGQGDCDSNAECQNGLVCRPDTGAAYGFPATVSTCGLPNIGTCASKVGDWSYCSAPNCGICGVGMGDCDADSECAPGLVCLNNAGASYGLPPTMDVCVVPTQPICTKVPGDWSYCSDPLCGPCQIGEGDCDLDSECATGLQCAFNAGEKHGQLANMDVCDLRQPQ